MKTTPEEYTYHTRSEDGQCIATVSEFPHLTATHEGGPPNAVAALTYKVREELAWWKKHCLPAPKALKPFSITPELPERPGGFLWWDTVEVQHDSSFSHFCYEHLLFQQNAQSSLSNHDGVLRNYTVITHLGLSLEFPDELDAWHQIAADQVTVTLRVAQQDRFEAPAKAFLEFLDTALLTLPVPITIPPRFHFSVRLRLNELEMESRRLNDQLSGRHDAKPVRAAIRALVGGYEIER